jgi:hypothetical protein
LGPAFTWCTAHDLSLNVSGLDKTVGVHFALVPRPDTPPPLTLRHRGTAHNRLPDLSIPFAKKYVYIGLEMHDDLNPAKTQDFLLKKYKRACAQVSANDVLHRCSLQTQRTYMLSMMGGSISNLLAMAPCGAVPRGAEDGTAKAGPLEDEMDKLQLQAVAACFHTTPKYLGSTGLTDMRMLPAAALLLQAYERFRLSAVTHDVPAAELLRVIHAELADPGSAAAQKDIPANQRSWCSYYYALIQRLGWSSTWRMPLDEPVSRPYEVRERSRIVARRAAYTVWSLHATKSLQAEARARLRDPLRATAAPSPTILALQMARAHVRVADGDITPPTLYKPSAYGASLGGSVLTYQTYGPGTYLALHRARKGRAGLFEWPYWADRRFTDARQAAERRLSPAELGEREAARARAIFTDTRCNLCGAAAGDVAHFVTTCAKPLMAARRRVTLGRGLWNAIVHSIAAAIHDAHKRVGVPRALTDAIYAMAMDSPEGVFITTCIVQCRPWAEGDARADWPVARALGTMFDRPIPRKRAGAFADTWAAEAYGVLKAVCFDWWKLLPARARATLAAAGHTLPAA